MACCRANATEQSSTSASDNNAADSSQQSDASHGITRSEADSAEPGMAQSQQCDIFPEAGQQPLQQNKRKRITLGNDDLAAPQKQKKQNLLKAGQKPKELPKKKKNRLGQRARQQLGRAKQSQQMLHGPYFTPPLLVGISRLLTRLHDNHSQHSKALVLMVCLDCQCRCHTLSMWVHLKASLLTALTYRESAATTCRQEIIASYVVYSQLTA